MSITRRQMLSTAAAAPFLAGAGAGRARAAAENLGPSSARFKRFTLGDMEVTTILAGTRTVPDPQSIFGLNVPAETFAEVSEAAFIPADRAQFFFTPTVVHTGQELILFDTGLNGQATAEALSAAGYATDQFDKVVISHMHGDHIGGLMTEGSPTFARAQYMTGQKEFDAFAKAENEGFEKNVRPLAEKMTFLDDGGTIAPGITAKAAFGHTPGHMAFQLESQGEGLLLAVDFANHYLWSLAYPDWEVRFDQDKEMAAKTRRALLDMLAAEKMPFIGYHMPFPALGYVAREGDRYRYVPESYQTMLDA